jgi:Tol biopolymer transport system component
MSLAPGVRLGAYEVIGLLGAGGMGEVYRARDTKLERDVAIKVLPAAVAQDPERLARFKREAQVLASLSHPHIGAIYGFEDSTGVGALVLELVEGPTLADRIAAGPIPIDEALPIARQIADALEAAHERGIIHRDLKPANIKLSGDGDVKVLDFGLAKALENTSASGTASALSISPTITSPGLATHAGVLLGTAAYMSPEQAKGRPLDKRSDIWSFGCVLFEMLSGRRAFDGEDITDVLAAIVRGEPDWTALPADTPAQIRKLLRRGLEKDRKKRLADIADARYEIDEAIAAPTKEPVASATVAISKRRTGVTAAVAVASALVAALLAGAAVWWWTRPAPAEPRLVSRFTIPLPRPLQPTATQPLAISRDGKFVYFVAQTATGSEVYKRPLEQLQANPVAGAAARNNTGGVVGSMFLSPDGQWIAFNDTRDGAFKKVSVNGGPAATICEAGSASGGFRGATWGSNGTIVFATTASPGLMQVSDAGGTPKPLTTPKNKNEVHLQPRFLPDGKTLLFVVQSRETPNRIFVLSLASGEMKSLIDGSSPKYVPSGHIVFIREGALWAVRFDERRLEVVGDAVPVEQGVQIRNTGPLATGMFDVSPNGTLLFSSGSSDSRRTIVWVDRTGRDETIPAPPREYTTLRISPDGRRVALDIRDQDQDIWVWDFEHPTLMRLTFDPALDLMPLWTPDGSRIIFASGRKPAGIYWQPADGTGVAEPLLGDDDVIAPTGISRDASILLLREVSKGSSDITLFKFAGKEKHPLIAAEKFNEGGGTLSPDGRWLAYDSNESGQPEVYVRPFPAVDSGGRWQVSNGGGTRPAWAPNGRELFYIASAGALMAVAVQANPSFAYGNPVKLFDGSYLWSPAGGGRPYDVSPDGRRFVMIKLQSDATNANLVIVENWLDHLRSVLPPR